MDDYGVLFYKGWRGIKPMTYERHRRMLYTLQGHNCPITGLKLSLEDSIPYGVEENIVDAWISFRGINLLDFFRGDTVVMQKAIEYIEGGNRLHTEGSKTSHSVDSEEIGVIPNEEMEAVFSELREGSWFKGCSKCPRKNRNCFVEDKLPTRCPARKRIDHLRHTYKLTTNEVLWIFLYRGYCSVCEKKLRIWSTKSKKTNMCIDHSHQLESQVGVRASIRGILCTPHNVGLGFAKDDIAILSSTMRFIESHDL